MLTLTPCFYGCIITSDENILEVFFTKIQSGIFGDFGISTRIWN